MHTNRFIFLDGLRGVAAIFVLIRHTRVFWDWTFYRSYLAVDLFFILSGFVIAYAYDERLRGKALNALQFMEIRLIRLYPVFFISLLFGGAAMAGKLYLHHAPGYGQWLELALMIAMTALFLPYRLAGNEGLFPLNGPYWSLFFEVVVNLLYAVLRPVLSMRVLAAIVLGSFGVLLRQAWLVGSFDLGFLWTQDSWMVGLSRAVFGVFAGLMLHRQRAALAAIDRLRLSPWLAVLLVAGVLASPDMGAWNGLMDLLALALCFPLCVLVASRGEPARGGAVLLALGTASYPMYVMHQPLAQLLSPALKHIPVPLAGMLFLALLLALSMWIESRLDLPFRRWLGRWRRQRSQGRAERSVAADSPRTGR